MSDPVPPFATPDVAAVFDSYPAEVRGALLALRRLVFDTAQDTPEAGRIEETLKWGQPAYLTPDTKSGSTLRLGLPKAGGVAVFTHCQTSLMSDFRVVAGTEFTFDGNRALHLDPSQPLPEDALRVLIKAALTYHLRKSGTRRRA